MSRTTQDTTMIYALYLYGTITLFGSDFQRILIHYTTNSVVLQPQSCRNKTGLGYSAFARRYLRNHYCFLLLRVLRCFSSPGLPHKWYYVFNIVGCPIRKSTDQCLCAAPRSISQLIASFIASVSLGIRRTPLITSLEIFSTIVYPLSICQ